MTSPPTISEQLERQGVLVVESTIPDGMTVDQWRRGAERRRRRPWRLRHRAPQGTLIVLS